ncbi:hypothetical protein HXX76_004935 [Chlamydomonas incerta]|uniref:Uncharacterized protein n=1 Tax=Chlamydomonas incerta TaxID=51695 RepID=A0A835T6F1_CHLIN|nr:hypothetical protein HXX76_004935 [Chlamydomonas incerta]|eukprot:KAG2439583.1 hypothetical protein HXX76_004935 [Chlamydomonas incerta]
MRASLHSSRCPATSQPVVDLLRRRRPQFCAPLQATQAADGPASSTASQQQHLQRSLEQGPANKLVVEFDYVAVAFKTEPRRSSKRRQSQNRRRSSGGSSDGEGGVVDKLFGGAGDNPTDAGYRSLEYVSGDRRVLFEDGAPSAGPIAAAADITSSHVSCSSPPQATSTAAVRSAPAPPGRALGGAAPLAAAAGRPAPPRRLGSARARAEATSVRVGAAAQPGAAHVPPRVATSVAASELAREPALAMAAAAAPGGGLARAEGALGPARTQMPLPVSVSTGSTNVHVGTAPGPDAVVRLPHVTSMPAPGGAGEQQHVRDRKQQPRQGGSRSDAIRPASSSSSSSNSSSNIISSAGSQGVSSPTGRDARSRVKSQPSSGGSSGRSSDASASKAKDNDGAHTGALPHTAADADMEAAAVELLRVPRRAVRANRVFHAELTGMGFSARGGGPQQLRELLEVLGGGGGGGGGGLGLPHEQAVHVLLSQPRVMRVAPADLHARLAALAAALDLPLGAQPLAAAVAAAPDALLQRTPAAYRQCMAALAAALALPRAADARGLMLRAPSLLRHPPAFYARSVQQLQSQLALAPEAARALAAAEPGLLCVSPGVIRANGAELRERLQLSAAQVGALAGYAPELLAAPPGRLAAAARRLVAALSFSAAWRAQMPRLLASPRNTAVALSFRSDRYERLEYLARTGRDGAMGFKEALSLEEVDFAEVFPGYSEWRREQGR